MDYRENQDDIVKGVYINIFIVVPTVSNRFIYFFNVCQSNYRENQDDTVKGKE